ncbi:hypothetical protein Tco_1438801 [Tanacetum coccineum]
MSNSNTNLQTQSSSVLHNDTVSSYSTSKVQEKTQLLRSRCMNSLRAIKSQFKFLIETLQDFEFKEHMQKYTRFDAQSFYDAMICNMDSIGKYMLEITLHQQRTLQLLKQKKLMQTQEDHSNPIPALNVDSLKKALGQTQQCNKMTTASQGNDTSCDDADIRPILTRANRCVSTEVHQAAETVTTSNELDLLFGPLFDEYFNGENQVVLKSSAVTTTDASNKRQQQPDSTSSTSTLATTVTANGNFDL